MVYSARKRRILMGSALALGITGMAAVFWLSHNHTDPVSVGMFRVAIALTVVGLAVRSYCYMDEVQRQAMQKRWFWGSIMGIVGMGPLVVALQTHGAWLDAAVQFFFHRAPLPRLYFSFGIMVPVVFQAVSVWVLRLVDKLSQGRQS